MLLKALRNKDRLEKLKLNYAYSVITKGALMDMSTALVCLYSMEDLELILYSCELNQDKMEVLLTALYNCSRI